MGVVRLATLIAAATVGLNISNSAARAELCPAGANALGVSRTLNVDTTGGPRFGAQYPSEDILQPGEVVLTFDDGPMRSHTPKILEALAAHCTKATFFVVGRMALSEPELLRETAQHGHTIALHTWSHKKLTATSAAKAKEDIELGHSVVEKALSQPVTPFFRFPYLAAPHSMLDYLQTRNVAVMGIDIDSKDFQTRKPEVMVANVLTQLKAKGKGIILFHDIQPSTSRGLTTLLDELKKQGFKVVHLVSKTIVPTVPEYDQQAARLIARRDVAGSKAAKPPAPLAPDSPEAPAVADELPWLRKSEGTGPSAPPAKPNDDKPSDGTPSVDKPWWEF